MRTAIKAVVLVAGVLGATAAVGVLTGSLVFGAVAGGWAAVAYSAMLARM